MEKTLSKGKGFLHAVFPPKPTLFSMPSITFMGFMFQDKALAR